MKRIKMFGVLALVGGAAGTFAMYEQRQMTALETRQHELAAAVAHAERTTQAARAERGTFARLALRNADVEPRAPAMAPPAPSSSPSEPPPPGAAAYEPADYIAHLDSSFAGENIDSAWERRANETVASRLAAHGDRSPRSIECRASMCRLVTDDVGREQASQQIRAIVGDPGDEVWSGAYFSNVAEGADGRPERVTYLFRNGTLLPAL